MSVRIFEVVSYKDLKTFVKLPFRIYKNNKYWVPPIIKDEINALDANNNPGFKINDAKFWLAYKNNMCVGRIGALVNHKYNEKTGEQLGRITRYECFDDQEVAEALFSIAEEWLKSKGMKGVIGPLGFTNLDLQGLLIDGFDHLPSVASVYHLPYYRGHFEKMGYEKEIDWLEFRITVKEIPDKVLRLNEVIKKRYGLEVVSFKSSSELKTYGEEVFQLLNKSFDELPFVTEFDRDMRDYYAKKYLSMLNPKYVKVVKSTQNQNIVAFIIGLPSLSEAMQKANGKLFPFGIGHILKALKKPKVIDLLLTGIDPKHQGQGVSALLITELQRLCNENGIGFSETTGIFETNQKAIHHWKSYEHIQHKRRRCFKKLF